MYILSKQAVISFPSETHMHAEKLSMKNTSTYGESLAARCAKSTALKGMSKR